MNSKFRTTLMGLVGAVAGFALQGCFTPQPLPECSVTITSAALGLSPYFVVLTKESANGTCGDMKSMQIGLQRYRTKASGGSFTLAVKASPVVDPYLGYVYSANQDPANDCVNEDDCQGAADPAATCVITQADGGLELPDTTPVDPTSGDVTPTDGGDPFTVDTANECGPVDEPVYRVDPSDPDGKKLTAIGDMPQFPTNGVCTVTNFVGGVENYQAETLNLVDGTTDTLPAITYKVEFENFNVLSTTTVPGTAFTSTIKYTEGSCNATFKAIGFWPPIGCADDTDCAPNADLDAGRLFGSGINPDFKPVCNKDLKTCVPSADLTTLK